MFTLKSWMKTDGLMQRSWMKNFMKMDGRCPIPAEIGGVKTCPLRINNPDYVEGGDMPKTIANSCDKCIYCAKRHAWQ
jgi:hypothetical protein